MKKIAKIERAIANKTIAVSTACLFCNPCARAKSHQQECAQKLCSATLTYETQDDFDSADPSSMQDARHIWTQLNDHTLHEFS